MNNVSKKYFSDCKKAMPFIHKKEKIFLNRLKDNLTNYTNENSDINYNDLCTHFGNPKEIMISYFEECDNEYVVSKMNIKKILNQIFIIIILGLLVIVLLELKTIQEMKNQRIITEEVIIIDEGDIIEE